MSFLPKAAVASSEETSTDSDLQTELQVEAQLQKPVASVLSPMLDLSVSNSQLLSSEPGFSEPRFSEPRFSVWTQLASGSSPAEAIAQSPSPKFSQLRDRLLGESPQPLLPEVVSEVALPKQKTTPVILAQADLTQTPAPETAPSEDSNSLPTLTPPPVDLPPATDSSPIPSAPPGTPPEVLEPETAIPSDTSEVEIDALPDSLFADPNPLTFPTTEEEVTIEQTPLVTIEQAIELAYRNNQSLQAALLSQEQAAAAVREARAELLPNVDIAANATTQESTRPTNVAGLGAVGEPSGADTTISGSAEINYDILTGGSRRASIRAAELQEEISTLAVEVQQEQIRLNTANAYYDLQNAGEQIRINQSFLEEAARNLRDSRLRQEVGVGTRFDTLRAEVQFANARQSVIQSQSQERIARRAISQLLNLPPNASLRATPVAVAKSWPLGLEESILLAFQNRAELDQQLYQADLNEEQRKIALAAIRPRVQLFANYSAQTFVNDNDGILDNYSFGARFNWRPFDGGAARARARQQELASQVAEEQFSSDLDQVRFDVEQSFFNLQANQENIATSEVAVSQAEEALALANLRLQAGVGTQLDVLTAQSELTQAEANNVAAILGYNRALVSIERAISNVSVLF